MALINFDYHPQFFTATILEWKPLLKDDAFKDVIIKSLQFLKNEGSVAIYAFVIMPNHMHMIWQIQDGFKEGNVRMRFLKFTAQQFKFRLTDTNDDSLGEYFVNAKDRAYQFWERNSLSVDLWTPEVFMQKFDYIHNNPLQKRWQLTDLAENYRYSSARFYETGEDEFGLITHYMGDD